ncbi:MAG: replicative DNA helicase [Gammaproteobacteria bacterium AqS3]|nr:replicative DNA helicase [Gammaproteobacteria bacterium AqS3]
MNPLTAPQAEQAERAVLGSLLVDPRSISEVRQRLAPEDFYDSRHAQVFEALENITGENPDRELALDAVLQWLERAAQIERSGGRDYIAELLQHAVPARHVHHHAVTVRDASMRRSLLQSALLIQEMALNPGDETPKNLIDRASKSLLDIEQRGLGSNEPEPVHRALRDNVEEIGRRSRGEGQKFIGTGFRDLDSKIIGLLPSNLVILAARPGMGKTALGLNIASNVAESGHGVLFFSLEMSKDELARRLLSERAEIGLHELRVEQPVLTKRQFDSMDQVVRKWSAAQMYIDDTSGLEPIDLRGKITRHLNQRIDSGEPSIGLVVVDYLQLMRVPEHADNRVREVSEISRSLKEIARDFKVTVLALAQLNRDVEKRGSRRPVLQDLRESGSIEQDADTVLMIHRPDVYGESDQRAPAPGEPPRAPEGMTEILIRKQRNGELGIIKLQFDSKRTAFLDYTEPDIDRGFEDEFAGESAGGF